MKYDYFVSYSHSDNKSVAGFGNTMITINSKINDYKNIKTVKEFIEEEFEVENVIILNYKLLKRHWR